MVSAREGREVREDKKPRTEAPSICIEPDVDEKVCSWSRPKLVPCQRRPTAAEVSGSYSVEMQIEGIEDNKGGDRTRMWRLGATDPTSDLANRAGEARPGHGLRTGSSRRPGGENRSDQSRVTVPSKPRYTAVCAMCV